MINYVKIHPMLWDKTCRAYRSKKLNGRVWAEIAEHLGTTVKQVKKRYRSLRDTFSRYLREVKNAETAGRVPEKIYWAHYEQMSFLANHIGVRNSGEDDDYVEMEPKEEEKAQEDVFTMSPFESSSPEPERISTVSVVKEETPAKRQRLDFEEDSNDIFAKELDILIEDETDSFMAFLATKIKKAKLTKDQMDQFQIETLKFVSDKLGEFTKY